MRRPQPPGSVLGGGLLAGLTLLLVGAVPASSAPGRVSADDGSTDIRITVTELSPSALTADSTLTVSARVVNASSQTLIDVGARLRLDPTPFGTRAELADFVGADQFEEVGTVVVPSLVDVAPQLAPGESAQVEIQVPTPELGLPSGFGVHALTLELRVAQPDGVRRTAGSVRTVLVDAQTAQPPAVRVAWVWPLIGTPARGPDGILPASAADALTESIAANGRLGGLLAAGTGRPVTWLVDGALLEDVRSLATGRGLAVAAQPDPTADHWLDTLTEERDRSDGDVRAVPYADPDLTAVDRAGLAEDLRTARTRGTQTVSTLLGGPVDPAPAWPAAGRVNRPTLRTLAGQARQQVIVDSDSLVPQEAFPATPDALSALTDQPGLQAVSSDAVLADLVAAGPARLGGATLARQRLLAETAMIAAERPGDPRSVVVAPPRRWAASPAWAATVADLSAPWIDPVTLASLEDSPGDAPARVVKAYPQAAVAAEVSAGQLSAVARDRDRLAAFASAVADPQALLDDFEPPLLSAQSTAWRGQGAPAGRAYTAAVTSSVDSTVNSVRLLPRGQVTLSSRTSIIPLAVQNDFDQTVRVRVQLTSTPSVRLSSDSTEIFEIPAHRTASVDLPAQATADATFPVVAHLLTPDGRPMGEPVTFTIHATGYGQVARVVVGGALLLLAGAVIVRVARRIRAAPAGRGGTLDP